MKGRFSIVGQKHRGDKDGFLQGVKPGEPVVLVREPTNQYDKNAVMVWIGGKHVGYIPSKTNAALAAHIDAAGEPFDTGMAADAAEPDLRSSITAKFFRSRNSGYPQVEVDHG